MPDLKQLTREANENLRFDEPLNPGDPRLVDLSEVRGDFHESRLLYELGIFEADDELSADQQPKYLLYGGHRGCGKSTALRQLRKRLHRPDRFFVVFIDALEALDINNLRYSDVVLAQAKGLFDALKEESVKIAPIHLERLEGWFHQRILTKVNEKDFAASLRGDATAKGGIPWLVELSIKLQNSIKINSTYKEEIRNEVRNHFSEFAKAFNQLVLNAEERIDERGLGKKLLFIIDGTDRLSRDDAERFFVNDIHQLQLIRSRFIYCAPINLLSEKSLHGFDTFRLPMIKLGEKSSDYDPSSLAAKTLRQLVEKRMSLDLFDEPGTLEYVIEHSGGHVRDLIRLLRYALRESQSRRITRHMAERAVAELASEYSRLIDQEDYGLLAEIDRSPPDYAPISDRTRQLLYNLILLEYNSYWWQTHPVVRTLPAYVRAAAHTPDA